MGDALELLLAHQLGDPLDHRGLVHLVGDLVDDDGVAVLADLLHTGLGADDDGAAPLQIGLARAGPAQDQRAGGKIGGGDIFDQLLRAEVGVLDQRLAGVDHLAQVVGRDVGGHAHRDAAGAVDQHVREARGQDRRLLLLAVVIVLEIDRVLVDIGQHVGGGRRHPHLGVAHGRRVIAVHGAEIALAVQKRQRHGEVLRHAHQRVVDRAVAMGVVLAHHVAHGPRRLAVGLVVGVPGLVHREKDAAVHRFQPVAQVGNGAGNDDAHRVVDERGLHLRRDVYRRPAVSRRAGCGFFFVFRRFWRVGHVLGPVSQIGLYVVGSQYKGRGIWCAMGVRRRCWQPFKRSANMLFLLHLKESMAGCVTEEATSRGATWPKPRRNCCSRATG
jgi:hypothetical protein